MWIMKNGQISSLFQIIVCSLFYGKRLSLVSYAPVSNKVVGKSVKVHAVNPKGNESSF